MTQNLNSSCAHLKGIINNWILPEPPDHALLALAARFNLSVPLMHTLFRRGLVAEDDLSTFLSTPTQNEEHDPGLLADAQKAVDRIMLALQKKERILIFGDYDVDGMTATALVLACLLKVGASVNFYLPNRFCDGYGLQKQTIIQAARAGYSLIITVDNGITAFDAVQEAHLHGIDVIITDHHQPQAIIPPAFAVINPLQAHCPYPCKLLAGVGVAYKCMELLFRTLGQQLPQKVYELLALGTIADVVPLLAENRLLVRHGMHMLNASDSLWMRTLKNNARLNKEQLRAKDIAFSLAPQLNALGRLSDPRSAISFLIGSDAQTIQSVGRTLFELNETRKDIERELLAEINQAIEQKKIDLSHEFIILAADRTWPAGIIGLVASRLVSTHTRPTALFSCTDDGIAHGSCRSIPALDIIQALSSCSDIIERFGGHSAAAGLTIKTDRLPLLKERLEAYCAARLSPADFEPILELDAQITLPELTSKFMDDLWHLEPCGQGNNEPLFYLHGVMQVQKPQLLKEQHVKTCVFADGIIKPLIFFNRPQLYPLLLEHAQNPFDCAVHVVQQTFNGRTNIELQGIDIALLEKEA